MTQHTLAALYDTRATADQARADLVAAGIPGERIQVGAHDGGRYAFDRSDDRHEDDGGFLAALKNLFMPDDDAHSYAEGVRRGGVLLTARVDDAQHERALDALERTHPLNIDEQSSAWRQSGWRGFDESAAPIAGGLSSHLRAKQEEESSIPVVEEELQVGKRQVQGGRVRVRSYVVETPVQESVSLHDEHVSVERRPAEGVASVGADAFREKVIEAAETREEPVVAKQARVKEEVVVRKEARDHTETVREKVRHTEVKVEDDRAAMAGQSSGGRQDAGAAKRRS